MTQSVGSFQLELCLINKALGICQNARDGGELLHEATGLLDYRITKDVIGKYISFECTPVRDDGTIGEPKIHVSTEPVRPGKLTFPNSSS
jgi:hypothetical protein